MDSAFEAWLRRLTGAGHDLVLSDEIRAHLRSIFEAGGSISFEEIVALQDSGRASVAKQLVEEAKVLLPSVLSDAAAADIETSVEFMVDDDSYVHVLVSYAPGRAWSSNTGWDPSPVAANLLLVLLADAVQEVTMERDQLDCVVWPVCPQHRLGGHADLVNETAVWWCNGGPGHVLAPIGELSEVSRRN